MGKEGGRGGGGGGIGDDWSGMGGSCLTGLPCVGEVVTGVGKVRGEEGRPAEDTIGNDVENIKFQIERTQTYRLVVLGERSWSASVLGYCHRR